MRITVVGGGPLGQFFAVHLAWAGADVSLLVRKPLSVGTHVVRSRSMPFGRARETRLRTVSELTEADAVVIAVRAEQVQAALDQVSAVGAQVVLVFTPLTTQERIVARERFPLVRAGMPALAAEIHLGVLRYWQAPSTLVECVNSNDTALYELVKVLRRGGVWVRVLPDVGSRSAATTTAFFPLHLAIHACPGLTRWRHEPRLVADLAQAMTASRRLAKRMGKVESGVAVLAWWMSKAWRVHLAARVFPLVAPALTHFLEQHFGAKLGLQHVKLAREIGDFARRVALPSPLLPSLTQSLPTEVSQAGIAPRGASSEVP